MRKAVIPLLIAVLAVLWLAGCTSYEQRVVPFKMPAAYPNATTVADATIAAKAYDSDTEAEAAFGFDIRGAGILPVQVIFDNTGNHPLEILSDKTLLLDTENNLWPVLDERMAYDRLSKKTELGKVAPEAAKGGLLAGAAGAVIGAAIGIVTGHNVGGSRREGGRGGGSRRGHHGRRQGDDRFGGPVSDPGGSPATDTRKTRRRPARGGPRLHLLPRGGQRGQGTPDQHPCNRYQAGLSPHHEILTG